MTSHIQPDRTTTKGSNPPFDLRAIDLVALNSMTKFPPIATHHELDPKNGGLLERPVVYPGEVVATEKIDGTNGRLIMTPDGNYVIGSREELLYARGDLIGNPALGIAAALKPIGERLAARAPDGAIRVYYMEVFGGKITGASKQYTSTAAVATRLFDCVEMADYAAILVRTPADIALWREAAGQRFLGEAELATRAAEDGLSLAPRLFTMRGDELPTGIEAMSVFLRERLLRTTVALDEAAGGRPEGLVLRAPDRSVISKARIEDYDRTMRRRR